MPLLPPATWWWRWWLKIVLSCPTEDAVFRTDPEVCAGHHRASGKDNLPVPLPVLSCPKVPRIEFPRLQLLALGSFSDCHRCFSAVVQRATQALLHSLRTTFSLLLWAFMPFFFFFLREERKAILSENL